MYSEVIVLFRIVSVPSVISSESLVHDTVVAGPLIEIHVSVKLLVSPSDPMNSMMVILSGMITSPVECIRLQDGPTSVFIFHLL